MAQALALLGGAVGLGSLGSVAGAIKDFLSMIWDVIKYIVEKVKEFLLWYFRDIDRGIATTVFFSYLFAP